MATRVFRIRLPQSLEAQVREVCELAQLTYSEVFRLALQYILSHPDLWPEILSQQHRRMLYEDRRTPQQAENWRRDYARLTDPGKLHQLLAQQCPPVPE